MIEVNKIGGNIIDNPDALDNFLKEFSKKKGRKILVHGGGKEATRLSGKLGVEAKMINGRRVTGEETIEIVTMVYAGLINKRIVSKLQAVGCDAIGLTGADGNVTPAVKRNPIPIDYGLVGDINPEEINKKFINLLLENGMTPVFCAICHDNKGQLLNCNADTIASSIAVALAENNEVRLTYCFEKPGVLKDKDDDSSVISLITPEYFETLVEDGIVAEGMIPKIQNAIKATQKGVAEVKIGSADINQEAAGTTIRLK